MLKPGNILRACLVVTALNLQIGKIHSWRSTIGAQSNDKGKNIYRQQRQPWTISSFSEMKVISRWYRRYPMHLSSQAKCNHEEDGLTMSNFPPPLVWLWSPSSSSSSSSSQQQALHQEDEWKPISEISLVPAAIRTWNWSKHFVLRLNLCPWAKGSLETPSAMQIFVVPKEPDIPYSTGSYANDICQAVADKCKDYLQTYPEMESSIIFFVVFQEEDEDAVDYDFDADNKSRAAGFHEFYDDWENFIDFHEWFTDLEDAWDMEDIIVAPFHPSWQFGGDGPALVDFEKKSPYPTVTFVSAKVVEQAGEAATAQIAQKNEETLQGKNLDDLKETWDDSSSSSPSMPW